MLIFEDLDNVEIFETGKYGDKTYSNTDLDNMVQSFEKTRERIKPPLVLGHGENQVLLKESGLPSGGWLKSLKRNGSKLIAGFSDVPQVLAELIKRKAYKRISSEIYPSFTDGKNSYGMTLRRVALLGGDIPRIKTLQDVAAMYSEDEGQETEWLNYDERSEEMKLFDENGNLIVFDEKGKPVISVKNKESENENIKPEVKMFSEDQVKQMLNQRDKAHTEEIGTLRTEIGDERKERVKSDIKTFTEQLVKNGNVKPAWVKMGLNSYLESQSDKTPVAKFTEDGKEIELSQLGFIKKLLSSMKSVNFEETTKQKEKEEESTEGKSKNEINDIQRVKIFKEVDEYRVKHECSFDHAEEQIFEEHPEYQKYFIVE